MAKTLETKKTQGRKKLSDTSRVKSTSTTCSRPSIHFYDSQITNLIPVDTETNVSHPSVVSISRERAGNTLRAIIFKGRDDSMLQIDPRQIMLTERYFYLPNYIVSTAVNYCLVEKNEPFIDGSIVNNTESIATMHVERGQADVTFEGTIDSIGKPHKAAMKYNHFNKVYGDSVYVHQASTTHSTSDISLNNWPWIVVTNTAYSLYKDVQRTNLFGKQATTLPRLEYLRPASSFKRYIESVEPCVSSYEFKKTKSIVEKFALNESVALQNTIDDVSRNNEDWISNTLPNYDYCYCTQESPLLNVGVIAPFCHDVWPEKENSMLERAVVIIRLVTEFWNLIRTETLKPIQDEAGNTINMQQFMDLFSCITLPGIPQARKYRFMKTESEGETPSFIIVSYRGVLFTMNVVDEKYQPLPLFDISNSLKMIINTMDTGMIPPEDGIGILTAADMSTWSRERARVHAMEDNTFLFSEIEKAIFVLSLDHMNVNSLDQLANEALFADGCNRWYDKSLNFYIYKNGLITLNINTRVIDSSTLGFLLHYMHLRILDEFEKWEDDASNYSGTNVPDCSSISLARLIKDHRDLTGSTQNLENSSSYSIGVTDLKWLSFTLDVITKAEIAKCISSFNALSSAVMTAVCKIDNMDTNALFDAGVHKDVFAHMVLHLTYFQMYFRLATMGCRISIKRFRNLRYDIFRASTKPILDWCKARQATNVDKSERDALFWKAHKLHVRLLRECCNGKGCDNHLNALRNASIRDGIPTENNMFEDQGFFLSGGGDRYEIFAESLGLGCTSCPVVMPCNPSGYGVGYSVAKSFLLFTVTSWQRETTACAPLFAASLKRTCQDIIMSVPEKMASTTPRS